MRPVILERGKDAIARRFDLAPILRHGRVIEDSNYCFGEGGAGTFSDGKLYTRATKRGPCVKCTKPSSSTGASQNSLGCASPHRIEPTAECGQSDAGDDSLFGGEVHFQSKVTELIRSPMASERSAQNAGWARVYRRSGRSRYGTQRSRYLSAPAE